jgi:hypothetical protein
MLVTWPLVLSILIWSCVAFGPYGVSEAMMLYYGNKAYPDRICNSRTPSNRPKFGTMGDFIDFYRWVAGQGNTLAPEPPQEYKRESVLTFDNAIKTFREGDKILVLPTNVKRVNNPITKGEFAYADMLHQIGLDAKGANADPLAVKKFRIYSSMAYKARIVESVVLNPLAGVDLSDVNQFDYKTVKDGFARIKDRGYSITWVKKRIPTTDSHRANIDSYPKIKGVSFCNDSKPEKKES